MKTKKYMFISKVSSVMVKNTCTSPRFVIHIWYYEAYYYPNAIGHNKISLAQILENPLGYFGEKWQNVGDQYLDSSCLVHIMFLVSSGGCSKRWTPILDDNLVAVR